MKYDFTSILDRRGKDAVAIDAVGAPGSPYPAPREGFDVIPMWVADMNFPVVPTRSTGHDRTGGASGLRLFLTPLRNITIPSSAGRKAATASPA